MNNAQKRMNAFKKGITKTMKTISIALGGLAVGKLIKDSLTAASELESAFVGLESILTGQGRSFSKAKAFINDYIQDGLIPLTDAITAYKNLAARGYNDEQIQQVLERLKDAAAFGRQSSYTLGEAVRTATEGLKNENSVLVDNAGVTKNVSKMWDEYAKTIGKNRNQLTQQEKIQAEVNGILQETQWQVGDAAKYADTYAGRLAALGKTLHDIKTNLGKAFMPIANIVLPLLQSLAGWLSRVTATLAAFSQALFGKAPKAQAKATQEQADAIAELGEATEEAGKQAKGAVASFDEVHQLQEDMSDTAAGDMFAMPGIESPVSQLETEDAGESETFTKMQETLEKLAVLFDPAIDGFNRLKEAASPLLTNVGEGLKWFWENILVPFGTWTLTEAIPAFFDLLAGVLSVLNPILEALAPLGRWLWEEFLKPAAEWTGQAIVDGINWLADALKRVGDWISEHSGLVETFAIIVGSFAAAWGLVNIAIGIWNVIGAIATGVTAAFGAAVAFLTSPIFLVAAAIAAVIAIVVLLVKHWDEVSAAAASAWEWVKETWAVVAEWFDTNIIQPLVSFFTGLWDGIKQLASDAWSGIVEIWQTVSEWFDTNVIQPVAKFFAGLWDGIKEAASNAWDGIKETWGKVKEWFEKNVIQPILEVFEDLKKGIDNIWDGIWSGIKSVVNKIIGGINTLIRGLNKVHFDIPDWVPIIGGKSFGISIPEIPKLARGAIVTSPTLAMIGERGPEAVIPLGRSGFADEIAHAVYQAIMDAIRITQASSQQSDDRELVLKIDNTVLARMQLPAIIREGQRQGLNLVVRPQGV